MFFLRNKRISRSYCLKKMTSNKRFGSYFFNEISHCQKFWTKLFVLIIRTCFFYGLSRCQIHPSTGSMSRYTNMTVFTVRKTPLNENTVNYSEMCKLSLEWEVLLEIWTIFRGDIEKWIWGNFPVVSILKFTVFSKLKTERHFNREVQSVTGSLTRRTDAKWLYPTNLDANWNTLTGLSFGVLSPTAIQILYSQFTNLFTSKPKRIKLARYV